MNKSLFFGIFVLVLLVSVPSAEAGWFDDLVSWFKEVLGFSQSEAELLAAKTVYTPQSKTIDLGVNENTGNRIKQLEYYANIEFIEEDGVIKHREDARSLKGSGIECNVNYDGENKAECLDWNFTSRTIKFSNDKDSGSRVIPLRRYKEDMNLTTKERGRKYKESVNTNLILDYQESVSLTLDADINDIIEFGEFSTTITLISNSTDGRDTYTLGDIPTRGKGTDTEANVYSAGDRRSHFYFPLADHVNQSGINVLNATFQIMGTISDTGADDMLIMRHGEDWIEDPTAPVSNASHDYNNNSADTVTSWGGGNRTSGFLTLFNDSNGGTMNSIAMPNDEVEDMITNGSKDFGIFILASAGGLDKYYMTREGATPPRWIIEYEILNQAPTFTSSPIINSTDGTNLSFEDLHIRFIPADADADTLTADVRWLKNSVSQFVFVNQSITRNIENMFTLESGNLTGGDLWSSEINLEDGKDELTQNSSQLEILSYLTTPTILLNSTTSGQLNQTNETLSCNFLCNDTVGNILTYNLDFLENSTLPIYSIVGESCSNPSYNGINLENENTSLGSFYSCNVNISSSSGENTTTIYSNNLTITSRNPYNITLNLPANLTESENNTLTYNVSAVSDEDIILFYEIYLDSTLTPTTLLSNETGNESVQVINTSVDGSYYWRARAVNHYGGQSDFTDPFFLLLDNSTVRLLEYAYLTNVSEGDSARFELNITKNDIAISSFINATLVYENTEYSASSAEINSSWRNYYRTINVPSNIDGVHEFNWTYNLLYNNGSTVTEVSQNFEQGVSDVTIFECDGITNTTQALAINITFWEETNNTQINYENETGVDFDANFVLWTDDVTINNTLLFEKVNQTEVDICVSPVDKTFKSDAVMEYDAVPYSIRNYYYDDAVLSNATQNLSLFLLHDDDSTLVRFTIQDSTQAVVPNVFISAQKYFVGTDKFELVAMGRSDDAGNDLIPLELNDVWYRFILTQNGVTKYIDPVVRRLSTTAITLKTDETTLGAILRDFGKMQYSITNTTSTIVLTFNDVSGASSKNCLTVYRSNTSASGFVCYGDAYCLESASGTITCNIGSDVEAGVYTARYYSTINPTHLIAIETFSRIGKEFIKAIGVIGLFGSFFIVLTMGLLGVSQRKVSYVVIFTFIGVLGSRILGLLDVSTVWIVSYAVLGGLVIALTKD